VLAAVTTSVVIATATAASASFRGTNGRIAYSKGNGQIASARSDGSQVRTLTSLPGGNAEAPMYSADGAWIVFDRYSGVNQGLYVMKADGSHLRRVVKAPGYEWGPSWSPDGRWIAYARDGGGSPIMAVRSDGTHLHRLGKRTGEYARYSPDGTRVAYGDTDGQIHVMHADGTHNHAVTSAGGDYPDWSPNGRWIGYTLGGDVWKIRPDGTGAIQITNVGTLSYSPVFSPDGRRIAYTDGSSVWTSKLDGTKVHTGPTGLGGCCVGWQPLLPAPLRQWVMSASR